MTSDLARAPEGASEERCLLARMLSGYCVSFSKLQPNEFDDVLKKILSDLYIRNLRGFKPLRQTISSGGDEPTNPDENTNLVLLGLDEGNFTMDTQTQVLHRGVITQNLTWREYETGEETNICAETKEWGANIVVRGNNMCLVLMRPPNSDYASDNLVLLETYFEKIPRRKEYRITRIVATHLPLENFRTVLGDLAPRFAKTMVMGIGDIISRSITALQGDISLLDQTKIKWRELSRILTE